MASTSDLKKLKEYYEEKVRYLQHLINTEKYYCQGEREYKHECYKCEIKELKKSIENIDEDIGETKKVERKYTPGRVKIKREYVPSKVKTTFSKSKKPTLAEKNEDIRKNFPKILKSMTKKSKTKVKRSSSRK
jgi:hypothetical protein